MEDFFSPKLLPVLSFSYLLVALSLSVTGNSLGGAPLCFRSCSVCLASWAHSVPLSAISFNGADSLDTDSKFSLVEELVGRKLLLMYKDGNPSLSSFEPSEAGCGYANGRELLALYTLSQTSFLLFLSVVVGMTLCLAWRVAEEESEEQAEAENWLKHEAPHAYSLREVISSECGKPASALRPEGGPVWVFFGIVASVSLTLLGWHNWGSLRPSPSATLLVFLNLCTLLTSTLVMHLGFFGRILALYNRNLQRVRALSTALNRTLRRARIRMAMSAAESTVVTLSLNDDESACKFSQIPMCYCGYYLMLL
jgi:hypothetical protein